MRKSIAWSWIFSVCRQCTVKKTVALSIILREQKERQVYSFRGKYPEGRRYILHFKKFFGLYLLRGFYIRHGTNSIIIKRSEPSAATERLIIWVKLCLTSWFNLCLRQPSWFPLFYYSTSHRVCQMRFYTGCQFVQFFHRTLFFGPFREQKSCIIYNISYFLQKTRD